MQKVTVLPHRATPVLSRARAAAAASRVLESIVLLQLQVVCPEPQLQLQTMQLHVCDRVDVMGFVGNTCAVMRRCSCYVRLAVVRVCSSICQQQQQPSRLQ